MLVRLMYVSRAVQKTKPDDLQTILKQSQARNPEVGITGVLCFSSGIFLQVLEGARVTVSSLYNRIAADPRHHEVMLLSHQEIAERQFACWVMGQVNMSRLNPALLLKYSERAVLDPYTVPAAASAALLSELVNTASIMG